MCHGIKVDDVGKLRKIVVYNPLLIMDTCLYWMNYIFVPCDTIVQIKVEYSKLKVYDGF